jgi:transposase
MVTATDPFATWLAQAGLVAHRLGPERAALLRAAFRFRQRCGQDYYSTRLLSHFLLHCDSGLKVAQVARLLGLSRPTASRQQGVSSKQVIQQAHHRLEGRPYGKLLPRYAGPLAHFLLTHPDATRADLIDFLGHTFGARVSRTALYHFLKRFGLDHVPAQVPAAPATVPPDVLPAATLPAPAPAPPFCSVTRTTPAPSC